MRANGTQLTEITSLIDAGIIRPILDTVFSFASTNEAIAFVEAGRAKGKVVVTMRGRAPPLDGKPCSSATWPAYQLRR